MHHWEKLQERQCETFEKIPVTQESQSLEGGMVQLWFQEMKVSIEVVFVDI